MTEVGWELKLKTAMRQLRKEGIQARLNIQECCRSCVGPEKLGLKEEGQPVVWHYGGQGSRILFDHDGIPYVEESDWNRSRSRHGDYAPEHLFFNHDAGGAQRAAIVFAEHGLTVEWDGSGGSCLEVVGPSPTEVSILRCQAEAYRENERRDRVRENAIRQVARLRREADELEASLS